jgi:hypothetical protein
VIHRVDFDSLTRPFSSKKANWMPLWLQEILARVDDPIVVVAEAVTAEATVEVTVEATAEVVADQQGISRGTVQSGSSPFFHAGGVSGRLVTTRREEVSG